MRKATINQIQECCARLSNPLKMEIFLKIVQEGCDCDAQQQEEIKGNCITSIVRALKIPQSTASMYIKDLRDCWQFCMAVSSAFYLSCFFCFKR